MKRKRLFLALLSIMVLSVCKKFKDKSGGSEVNPDPPLILEFLKRLIMIGKPEV
jgi:hypothetical protein